MLWILLLHCGRRVITEMRTDTRQILVAGTECHGSLFFPFFISEAYNGNNQSLASCIRHFEWTVHIHTNGWGVATKLNFLFLLLQEKAQEIFWVAVQVDQETSVCNQICFTAVYGQYKIRWGVARSFSNRRLETKGSVWDFAYDQKSLANKYFPYYIDSIRDLLDRNQSVAHVAERELRIALASYIK